MAAAPKYNRRNFLKDSALSFVKTAQEFVKHRDAPSEQKPTAKTRHDWLRPPGAVEEALFLERCTRCDDCAKACPHDSITFDRHDGSPVIFADEQPCRLCDDFPCIEACATEALLPVDRVADVRMGLAMVSHRLCTAGQGCHACVSQCPTQALSTSFDSMQLKVAETRCVGCGICEQVCRTVNDKIAIRVTPARLRTPAPDF
ncbi:MAG: 4Fe-4S dicluster domain-containing protein [Nitrospira sp.]|nr:4Fe-4S ferredoxin [Nitrospira sp.]